MQKSESIKNIASNLIAFRKELKQPSKNANNPFFKSKYVMLEGVVKSIDEALDKLDMTYMQEVTSEGNQVSVSTILLDKSGEYIQFEPLSVPVTKNDAQAFGSAETYARRYTLSAVFGVTSDVDDDGNAASKSAPSQRPSKPNYQGSPNKPASDKQIKKIHAQFGIKAKRIGENQDALEHALLAKTKKSDFREMTSQEASKTIKWLIDKNDKAAKEKQATNSQPQEADDPFAGIA